MIDLQFIKNYPDMFKGQTKKARSDIAEMNRYLKSVSGKLTSTLKREEELKARINEIDSSQKRFHERVEEISQRLHHLKSLLATA